MKQERFYIIFFSTGIVLLLAFLCSLSVQAQSYGTTLGLRFGNNNLTRTIGLSMQHRIFKKVTLEGIVQSDFSNNTTAHALIEQHHGFLTKRFNIYAGTGIALGSEESEVKDPMTKELVRTFGNATVGVDLILGIEFTLLHYNFSLDYKPNFNMVGREEWYRGQVGFSARSVLVTGAKQNKKRRKRARGRKKKQKTKDKEETPLFGDFFQKVFKKKN